MHPILLLTLIVLGLGAISFLLSLATREKLLALEHRLEVLERQIITALENQRQLSPTIAPTPEAAAAPPSQKQASDTSSASVDTVSDGLPRAPTEPGDGLPFSDKKPDEPAAPKAAQVSIEERLGARWSVWVGGAAIALGALFLVRYSIDQGLLGPPVRIGLGMLLALILIAAGEVLRRRDPGPPPLTAVAGSAATAYIPGVLTATGTIAAFASTYAAHALYGFIGPGSAFLFLGAIGVAAMFAAALHGPGLAGLGLVGALATPLLVVTDTPNAWALTLYLAIVTASAYALARLRNWLWLALSTAAGGWLWAAAMTSGATSSASGEHAALAHGVIQLAFACFIFALDRHAATPDESTEPSALALAVPAAFAAAAALTLQSLASTTSDNTAWIVAAGLDIVLLAVTGLKAAPAAGTLTIGILVFLFCLGVWPKSIGSGRELLPFLLSPSTPRTFAAFAAIGAVTLGTSGGHRLFKGERLRLKTAAIYAVSAALAPLGALILVYLRMAHGEASMPLAAIAAATGVGFATAAGIFRSELQRREDAPLLLGLGAMASAALAALALAFTFALSGGTLTVALALTALGAAFVAQHLNIPALRWCVAALGFIIAARLAYDSRVVGAELGTTPIFNWLLFGYGVPALSFSLASLLLQGGPNGRDDIPKRSAEALAILFSALLFFFEIRHAINGGNPFAATSDLVEEGLFAVTSFGFALALSRLDQLAGSIVLRIASLGFGLVGLAIVAFALLFAVNPLFDSGPVEGNAFFNALLLSYLGPAILALLAARSAKRMLPYWYFTALRIAAAALVFAYLSLEVRRLFQGPVIDLDRHTSNAEWYTYSILWLVLGIFLLAFGIWRHAKDLRVASAVFVIVSILKVFLFDLAWLEGILRAASFIGLGLILIGIGLVYQKVVFTRPTAADSRSM
jgi:uncharacterized membrane protein